MEWVGVYAYSFSIIYIKIIPVIIIYIYNILYSVYYTDWYSNNIQLRTYVVRTCLAILPHTYIWLFAPP